VVRFDDGDEKNSKEESDPSSNFLELVSPQEQTSSDKKNDQGSSPARKKRRWGATSESSALKNTGAVAEVEDDLDKFMENLKSGAMGRIETPSTHGILSADLNGNVVRPTSKAQNGGVTVSGGTITPEELARLMGTNEESMASRKEDGTHHGPSDLVASTSEVSLEIVSRSMLFYD
jgi:hypothetical protein